MVRMVIVLALSTFVSTLLGGLFALRNRDRLHLVLGFTAGVILGVVAFDVLPEIARLSRTTGTSFSTPMIALVAGFLFFHLVEKSIVIHHAHESEYGAHSHPTVGLASALPGCCCTSAPSQASCSTSAQAISSPKRTLITPPG